MGLVAPCEMCGNEIETAVSICPYCRSRQAGDSPRRTNQQFRTVNLEKGMPLVDDAVKRLRQEIESARTQGCRILVLIHGYGSSGEGGAIKQEVQRLLGHLQATRQIKDYLTGEACDRRIGRGRQMLRQFPFLLPYLQKPNPGISLVVV